jgi:hypothetical protein
MTPSNDPNKDPQQRCKVHYLCLLPTPFLLCSSISRTLQFVARYSCCTMESLSQLGSATERAEPSVVSPSGSVTDQSLKALFEEACENAKPWEKNILERVDELGCYPQRHTTPQGPVQFASNALAKTIANRKKEFAQACLRYLEATQTRSTANQSRLTQNFKNKVARAD